MADFRVSEPLLQKGSPSIFKAIDYAGKAHAGQFRKGCNIPYIYHPMDVGRFLMELDCPDELVVAAILHDTVEDTVVTLGEIETHFGPEVAALVCAVTEPEMIVSWEVRKTHTIRHLKTVADDALYVICADKFDNVRSIRLELERRGDAVWDCFSRPKEDQHWYYRAIAEVLESRIRDEPLLSLFNRYKREIDRVFA